MNGGEWNALAELKRPVEALMGCLEAVFSQGLGCLGLFRVSFELVLRLEKGGQVDYCFRPWPLCGEESHRPLSWTGLR